MARRIAGYWRKSKVFFTKQAYLNAVCYDCPAVQKYWSQGETVFRALDGSWYTKKDFTTWYGNDYGSKFWNEAMSRAEAKGDTILKQEC